ncbi:hypothetical protein [Nostoc sp.]|uniref:hypothetical protein n=1 Tax=Nostoc sp. TaxID=1180 RepID=UPI002FFD51AF
MRISAISNSDRQNNNCVGVAQPRHRQINKCDWRNNKRVGIAKIANCDRQINKCELQINKCDR